MVEKFYLYRVKLTNTPIMRRIFYLLFLVLLGYSFDVKASDTVFIHETQIPVLIERQDNVLFYLRLDAKESKKLDEIILDFSKSSFYRYINDCVFEFGPLDFPGIVKY